MNLNYTDIAALAGYVVLAAVKDCLTVVPARDQLQFRDGAPDSITISPECIEYRYAHGLTEYVFPENGSLAGNLADAMAHELAEDAAAYDRMMARFRLKQAA